MPVVPGREGSGKVPGDFPVFPAAHRDTRGNPGGQFPDPSGGVMMRFPPRRTTVERNPKTQRRRPVPPLTPRTLRPVWSACLAALVVSLAARRGPPTPGSSIEGGDGPGQGQARRPGQRRRGVPLRGGAAAARQDPGQAPRLQVHRPVRHRPKDGTINPNRNDNIPGLEALETADLMVIATRFRDLPDDQMKHIVDYVESGRPIIGMRTATHAFNLKTARPTPSYTWQQQGMGRRASAGRCSARPGSTTTASTASRAPAASSPRGRRTTRSSAASRTATSGARPTSTASTCRCPATASRWCWARSSRA